MYSLSRLLVPVDFSSCSEKAVGVAMQMAVALGADLTLLFVASEGAVTASFEDVPIDEVGLSTLDRHESSLMALANQVADELDEAGRGRLAAQLLHVRVEVGVPADGILALVHELGADVVIMGTQGRNSLKDHIMGSTTEQIVRRAPCAVMAIKPDGRPATE